MTLLAYFLLWLAVMLLKPQRRDQKGYIWRVLKQLPPWRWIRETGDIFDGLFRRYPRWLIVLIILWVLIPSTEIMYLVLITLEVDDWLNGDDDERKRRWESVRNKVKWLMELPAPPQEVKVRG